MASESVREFEVYDRIDGEQARYSQALGVHWAKLFASSSQTVCQCLCELGISEQLVNYLQTVRELLVSAVLLSVDGLNVTQQKLACRLRASTPFKCPR